MRFSAFWTGLSLLGGLTAGTASGALPQVSLVKNINLQVAGQAGLRPRSFTSAGTVTYFVARNGANQEELWKTDGTTAGTVQVWDAAARVASYVTLDNLTVVGDKLFFTFQDADHGLELWVTDGSGTPGSTHLVADLVAGPESSVPRKLTPFKNGIIFIAQGTLQKRALWFADGTETGTRLIMDLPEDEEDDYTPRVCGVESNGLFYFATQADGKQFVYRTDGTASGTLLLKEMPPSLLNRDGFVKAGNLVLFRGAAKAGNDELWKTDGTVKGTTLLKEIRAGAKGSGPRCFSPAGNLVYFIANQNDTTPAVWRTDGTAAGTKQVALLQGGGTTARLVPVGNYLLTESFQPGSFEGQNRGMGNVRSLSLTTGQWENVFEPEPDLGGTYAIATVGPLAFFVSVDSMEQETMWVTDGTKAGTRQIDAAAIPQWHQFGPYLGVIGNRILFRGYAPEMGTQLWVSDGTEAGTHPLDDVEQDAGSNPSSLTAANGVLYFSADDGVHGRELWKSDGTEAGTVMVKDIWPGQGTNLPNSSAPVMLAEMNGIVYFSADDGTSGVELWRTDGTEAGTVRVKDINSGLPGGSPKNAAVFDGKLFFAATTILGGEELWVSDGTEAGTLLQADLHPAVGSSSRPSLLTAAGGHLYFVASTTGVTQGLWRMPVGGAPVRVGTVQQISRLIARPPTPGVIYKPGQWLVYAATQNAPARELWVSDGTDPGTQLLGSFPAASSSEGLGFFSLLPGGDVIFSFGGLYRLSGAAYARLPYTSVGSPDPKAVLTTGSRLFYTVQIGSNSSEPGYQLWTVDTASDAAPTKLYQARRNELVSLLQAVQGNAFFLSSENSQRGTLWTSGGTEASTREIMPPHVSFPVGASWSSAATDSHLFLAATTSDMGQELHSFRFDGQLAVAALTGAQTHPLTSGGTLDLGPKIVGQSGSRTLRLENLGIESMTGLTLAFGGSGSVADFGITQSSIPTLTSGQVVDVEITFTPQEIGARPSVLEIRQGAEVLFSVQLTGTGLASDTAPVITQQPASRIVKAGMDVTFSAAAVSAQDLTLDWRRDGDATVGTESTLTLTNVQPADVANYTVNFINNTDAALTSPAALAVVMPAVAQVAVAEHQTLMLNAIASAPAGCTLTYQWRVDGYPLTDDDRIQGSRTASLRIANHSSDVYFEANLGYAYTPYEGRYDCLITLIAPDRQETVNHGVTQVSVLPVPLIQFLSRPAIAFLGQAVDIQIEIEGVATQYFAQGLPPGLTLNPATGRITGTPTKLLPVNKTTGLHGTYAVTYSAANASGQGPGETWPFTVVPAVPAGSYDGLLGRSSWIEGSLGGRVTLTATTTGAQSGKLLYEGKSYALTKPVVIQPVEDQGYETTVMEFTISRGKILSPLKLRVTTQEQWYPYASQMTLTDGEAGHIVTGELCRQTTQADRATKAGYFTWSLTPDGSVIGYDFEYPQGAGYLLTTVSKTATVTWKGKLADGTAITGSGLLATHDNGVLGVAVHQDLYSLKGSVHGWLPLDQSVQPLPPLELEWFKTALPATSKERKYKNGIQLHTLHVSGGRYVPPAKNEMLLGSEAGEELYISFSGAGLSVDFAHPFSLTAKNTVVLARFDPANLDFVKSLSFSLAQGTFKGSFTLSDPNPDVPKRPWTRVVPFEGVILKEYGVLDGFFLLPELPEAGPPATTLTTSPMHSGRVYNGF